MRIGILGTGNVAQTLGRRWLAAGHEITYGSRDPMGKGDLGAPVAPHGAAVENSDIAVNATPGPASLEVVKQAGAPAFAGKILVDVANQASASFDQLVYPDSSVAEKLQAALPEAKVVKTMNTAAIAVMTEPGSLPPSSVFLSGDDADAKATVASLLADFGWPSQSIVDLGGIASARGPEHFVLLFGALMRSLGTPAFNIQVVT
jgi:8-hydroxy-5-deazaflavin:NADPH oxidoreductase